MGLVTKKCFLTYSEISSCKESRHLLLEYVRLFVCKNIYFVALFVKSFLENIEDSFHVNNHLWRKQNVPACVCLSLLLKKSEKKDFISKPNCMPVCRFSKIRFQAVLTSEINKTSLLLQRGRMINIKKIEYT